MFDPKKITRNRTVGWGVKKAGEKPGAITTDDCMHEDGSVNTEACKRYNVEPARVTYITVNDLPSAFGKGPKEALTALAMEWSTAENKWTPDDVAHYLALQSRLQDAANDSVKQHRPVSDKALDRATSTIVKTLKGQGKTLAEVTAALGAVGIKASESDVRSAYGA